MNNFLSYFVDIIFFRIAYQSNKAVSLREGNNGFPEKLISESVTHNQTNGIGGGIYLFDQSEFQNIP